MPATMTYTVVEDSAAAAQAAVGEDVEELSFWDAAGSGTPPSGGSALLSVSISNNPAALTLAAMLQLAANEFVYTQNESAGETNFLVGAEVRGGRVRRDLDSVPRRRGGYGQDGQRDDPPAGADGGGELLDRTFVAVGRGRPDGDRDSCLRGVRAHGCVDDRGRVSAVS